MPRDAGDGRLPAFKERQDHGAVDNNQLKVFSEAAVRKATCATRSSVITVLQ